MAKLHETITAKIIAQLESGVCPWKQPWSNRGFGSMPRNAVSGRAYSGINIILLYSAAQEKGYSSPLWVTYKQAQDLGGNVRKGEASTMITFYSTMIKKDADTNEEARIGFLKSYLVFNVEQCDGLDKFNEKPEAINTAERDALAEEFLAATQAKIAHQGARAFYSTATDSITLPHYETFNGASEYYSTAFHELTHWTGAKHRLDRVFGKRFGDATYSAEELTAELGAAFMCAEFGFDNDTIDNSAAYLDHWLKVLKASPELIITAASKASKAVEYVRGLANENNLSIAAE